MDYRKFITESLTSASEIARNNFGKVGGVVKPEDPNQVLTQTDLEIGHALVVRIKQQFSKHNIIDEEAGVIDNESAFTWVVDPIDGTSNFASGVPMYGVMLGILDGEVPVAGGIALPEFNQIVVAQRGMGATLNGERIRVTHETQLQSCLVAVGVDGHRDNPDLTRRECALLAEIAIGCRNLRSSNSVFDAVQVAKGAYGAFMLASSKIWDNVAQQVVLEEAGAIYTDIAGNPIDYSKPLGKARENFTFCAASPQLHDQLQKIIHSIRPEA